MFKEKFIKLCNSHGKSPSFVCRAVGLNPATFTNWTNESVPRRATLMRIAEYFNVPMEYFTEKEKKPEEKSELIFLPGQNIHMIPLYENVSAGFGAMAINYVLDYIPMYFVAAEEAKETICVKVIGDSMYPKIEDGDIIQVHKQDSVDSGSIAVVLVDREEALVKKILYGDSWIELHSFNPMYKTMRFNGSDVDRVAVLGLVKKIIKTV